MELDNVATNEFSSWHPVDEWLSMTQHYLRGQRDLLERLAIPAYDDLGRKKSRNRRHDSTGRIV